MTDEQAFLELMKRFGIEPSKQPNQATYVIEEDGQDAFPVRGYYGFNVRWTFDSDGKFISLGIWE